LKITCGPNLCSLAQNFALRFPNPSPLALTFHGCNSHPANSNSTSSMPDILSNSISPRLRRWCFTTVQPDASPRTERGRGAGRLCWAGNHILCDSPDCTSQPRSLLSRVSISSIDSQSFGCQVISRDNEISAWLCTIAGQHNILVVLETA